MGVEYNMLPIVYCNLVHCPDTMRTLRGCPLERRKELLKHIVSSFFQRNLNLKTCDPVTLLYKLEVLSI